MTASGLRGALSVGLTLGALVQASPVLSLDAGEMRDRTAFIAERYLAIWSSGDPAAVSGVPYMYGPTVRFYGRTYTQAELMGEKRRAVRQWPIRRYAHRPGTMRITCNVPEMKCAAQSTIDYAVSNPGRGARKRGSARFDLGIDFSGRQPRILYEGGGPSR